MFLFADCQHSQREGKAPPLHLGPAYTAGLDLVQSSQLLPAHSRPFMIVMGTNTILCPEMFDVT